MRFEKGHKEATRKWIVDVASRRFRRDGAAASGLAGIMGDAGLTNGAFYPHFASKEALLRETIAAALAQQHHLLQERADAQQGLEGAVRGYLNRHHLEGPGEGCPSAALLPEIARQPETTRQAYEDGLLPYIQTLADELPNPGSPASRQRAMAIFGMLVGTLQIARAVSDATLANDILEGGVEAALALAATMDAPE